MTNVVTIAFQGDTLFAVEETNVVGVAIKPICADLGVAWNKQLQRIKRDPILSKGMTITVTPSPGGPQEMVCLDIHLVAGWLFGIDENRCNEKSRPKVRAYREQCFHVLHDHFFARKGVANFRTPGGHASLAPGGSVADEVMAMSVLDKMKLVNLNIRAAGGRAGCEMMAYLGLPMMPSAEAMLRQAEFKFTIDLDTNGPIDVAEMN